MPRGPSPARRRLRRSYRRGRRHRRAPARRRSPARRRAPARRGPRRHRLNSRHQPDRLRRDRHLPSRRSLRPRTADRQARRRLANPRRPRTTCRRRCRHRRPRRSWRRRSRRLGRQLVRQPFRCGERRSTTFCARAWRHRPLCSGQRGIEPTRTPASFLPRPGSGHDGVQGLRTFTVLRLVSPQAPRLLTIHGPRPQKSDTGHRNGHLGLRQHAST